MTQDQSTATPDPSLSAWFKEHEARRKALEANGLATNKAAIFDALAAAGVTQVDVNFDGYGDSGQIEEVTAMTGPSPRELPSTQVSLLRRPQGQTSAAPETVPLSEAIETLVYDFLEATHDGWEINEGAYGDFVFDVTERTIRLEYNQRIESTEYSEHQF